MRTFIWISVVLLVSCKASLDQEEVQFYENSKKFTNEDFINLRINFKILDQDIIPDSILIKSIGIIGDDIALLTEDNNVYIIDSNLNLKAEFFNDSLDMIGGTDIIIKNKKEFFTYDLTKNVLHRFLLDTNKKVWNYSGRFHLNDSLHGFMRIVSLPNNSFIGTSLNNIKGKVINFKIDNPQAIVKYIGKIPQIKEQNKYITGMAYRSTCAYEKFSGRIYVAHYYTDLIESYNMFGELLFKLSGPDNFRSNYDVGKRGGQDIFVNTQKTRKAFLSMTTDSKFLYLLFSGQTRKERIQNSEKTIYIFSVDGIPYKKIDLNIDINKILIDTIHNRLYGFYNGDITKKQVIYFDTKSF